MSRPNNTPLLAVVVLAALGGIAFLNRAQYESRPRSPEEIQQEEQERNKPKSQGTSSSEAAPAPGGDLEGLQPESYVGTMAPEREVTIGYTLSPTVQGDPAQATDALRHFSEMLERVNSQTSLNTRFRLVNVDIIRDVPEGIWLDGHYVTMFNLGTLRSEGSHLVETIMREIKSSFPPSKKPSPLKK
ncbi:hypothetical protein [Armatimonas rosea]|uniref:Uncharacterized protein n=1 Tax=Armatimonas rosea TaxID=685828 RepID=A0A7W9W878_ARMRO|nr:hypothetical protein [Armatimonas rosea]MBB6051991.1 hypothetical protein [Armatimonas rosea]